MNKDIAVVILNYVQLNSIKIGIDKLIEKGYSVDIYCQTADFDKEGFKDMFNDIRGYLKENNYNVYGEVQEDISYKVLLEPYPCMDIPAKYAIRYFYGCSVTTKPSVVYVPQNFLKYIGLLSTSYYDEHYLEVYSKTFKIPNMKFNNFKKKKNKKYDKKVLVYLPTYGEGSSIDLIASKLKELKENYYLIIKMHHGTNFLKNEKNRIIKLKKYADEFYDSHKDLKDLLEVADVVLTDSSASLFEALYLEIPVALFCDNINKFKLKDFDTVQSELVKEGIVPYTNNKNKILDILNIALKEETIKKQNEWNKKNMYHCDDITKDFVKIIENFLEDKIDQKYVALHNVLRDDYYGLRANNDFLQNQVTYLENYINNDLLKKIEELNRVNNELNYLNDKIKYKEEEIKDLKKQLDYYKNGKLYKAANKIYKISKRG